MCRSASRWTRLLCAALAALVVVVVIPTLFVDGIVKGTPVMNCSARSTALTIFGLALPVLIDPGMGTIWLSRKDAPKLTLKGRTCCTSVED